jgi:hypothetical protein
LIAVSDGFAAGSGRDEGMARRADATGGAAALVVAVSDQERERHAQNSGNEKAD